MKKSTPSLVNIGLTVLSFLVIPLSANAVTEKCFQPVRANIYGAERVLPSGRKVKGALLEANAVYSYLKASGSADLSAEINPLNTQKTDIDKLTALSAKERTRLKNIIQKLIDAKVAEEKEKAQTKCVATITKQMRIDAIKAVVSPDEFSFLGNVWSGEDFEKTKGPYLKLGDCNGIKNGTSHCRKEADLK